MRVQRKQYLEELQHRMHNGLVKIITGIRRSGKSYLLSVLFKEYLLGEGVDESHIIEVPLDKDETGWLIDGPNIPGRPFWVMRHRTPLLT